MICRNPNTPPRTLLVGGKGGKKTYSKGNIRPPVAHKGLYKERHHIDIGTPGTKGSSGGKGRIRMRKINAARQENFPSAQKKTIFHQGLAFDGAVQKKHKTPRGTNEPLRQFQSSPSPQKQTNCKKPPQGGRWTRPQRNKRAPASKKKGGPILSLKKKKPEKVRAGRPNETGKLRVQMGKKTSVYRKSPSQGGGKSQTDRQEEEGDDLGGP